MIGSWVLNEDWHHSKRRQLITTFAAARYGRSEPVPQMLGDETAGVDNW